MNLNTRSCRSQKSKTKAELLIELEMLHSQLESLQKGNNPSDAKVSDYTTCNFFSTHASSLSSCEQKMLTLNSVFNWVSEPVVVYDECVIIANEAAVKQIGFNPEGLTYNIILEHFKTRFKDYEIISNKLNEAFNGTALQNVQFEINMTNDTYRLFQLSLSPINIVSGRRIIIITWYDDANRKIMEDVLSESKEVHRIMGEAIPYGTWLCDGDGRLQYCSPPFLNLLQMSMEEARHFGWTKKMIPEDVGPMLNRWLQCIKTGETWECEYRFIGNDSAIKTVLSRGRPIKDKNGKITCWVGINFDITERKKIEDDLRKIEWLLNKQHTPLCLTSDLELTNSDILCKNETGEILRSCGKYLLVDIVSDYLDLLETCASIHELDGSYALNIYRSSWCKFLNNTSTRSSELESFSKNSHSAESLCSNCRWKDSYKLFVDTGEPVDVECAGGIRIYSVPIKAGKQIIGTINFGYGDPPKDANTLKNIARKYNVNTDQLSVFAKSYESRPQFIIDIAKKRLFSSARFIGSIVERKRAEIALQKAYDEIEKVVDARTEALTKSYNLLKEETRERIKAETESYKMNQALELVYEMATAISVSLEEVVDKVVLSISKLIQIPAVVVALSSLEKNEFKGITQIINNELIHFASLPIENHPCGIVCREGKSCQITGDLKRLYPLYMKEFNYMKSFTGVPIMSSKGRMLGAIGILDITERTFNDYEKHLIEIFARYIGHEIERKQMERQLLQSQEMKMLGQLTSGVAHEVRNPLNGILAITEALSKDLGENPDYSNYIEHIKKQVMRLSDLMKDLLNLGRPIEKANMMPASVSKIIFTAVNLWQQSTNYRDHSVDIKVSDKCESVKVHADRAKIEQVIINLLENACAHSSPVNSITIEVQGKGKVVIIKVIDRGTGIKPENFEHLFEPFYTTRRGGTGLGLGIVKRIVESHGGSIEINNNYPPPGVSAEICLPVIDDTDSADICEENTVSPTSFKLSE